MKNRNYPNNHERQNNRRTHVENAVKILPKGHRGQCNGRRKSNRSRHESRHEPKSWVINFRKKMVLASGTRQRGGEFAVTESATKRRNSSDDPEHQQRESRLNIIQLKAKARENAGSDNVGDHYGAGGDETDGAPRSCRFN